MGLLPAEPQTIINMRSLCAEVLNMAAMNGATCMPENKCILGKSRLAKVGINGEILTYELHPSACL